MYICNINLFWFFLPPPPPCQPKPPPPFSSVPFKGCSEFPIFNSKKKEKKKKEKKCIVSCRVVSLTLELGIVLNACRRYDEGKKNNNQKKGGHIQESNRVGVLTTLSPKENHRSRERGSSTMLIPLSFVLIIILIHQKREKGGKG